MQRLNRTDHIETACSRIATLLAAHAEWFLTINGGDSQTLNRSELDIKIAHGRLILSSWTPRGSCAWKIFAWECIGEHLRLEASRRMGAERPLIEVVPRASASSIAVTVKLARQARCEVLARLVCSMRLGAKLERVSLSPGARRGQPGKYARIILRQKDQRLAVTGCIAASKAGDADAFLSAALIWFKRLSERVRAPYVQQLWLAVEPHLLKPTVQRIALLRDVLKECICVYEVDPQLSDLRPVDFPQRNDLWRKRLKRFPPVPFSEPSEISKRLRAIAPQAIDVVTARYGETLRYFGLPFARVRRVMGSERIWFGLETSRRLLLDENTEKQLTQLLSDLQEHRSPTATDHHHSLYRNAAEAWLESLLRRDITRLDPGLIIAPLHAQFRIARGVAGVRPIDLLALRHDGRLAVIELKVSEAREHVLQGADYWQRVEAHRRRGHIKRAKLFGERQVSNEPPLIYLVAPTLRVHPAFNLLARSIAHDIEIYRFDINEDWRAGVRVMRRLRVN